MKNLKHDEEESKKFSEMTLHGKEKDFYKMKLKGVIIHSGSADVGHYYSIIPNEKKNGWLKMDDSRASSFPISGFENDCYGGNWQSEEWGGFGSSVNAYVLIYERVVKNPI
jgi:ubiquitin carboxyl-terminal hydrolase 34